MLFFSSYEYSKKTLINAGMQDFMAYLAAGLVGDLFASAIYVPSEAHFFPLNAKSRSSKLDYNFKAPITTLRFSQVITISRLFML